MTDGNERKREEEDMSPLPCSFGETPFKNTSEIHNELMADFGRIIVNDAHIQNSQVEVCIASIECLCELLPYLRIKSNVYKIKRVFFCLDKITGESCRSL